MDHAASQPTPPGFSADHVDGLLFHQPDRPPFISDQQGKKMSPLEWILLIVALVLALPLAWYLNHWFSEHWRIYYGGRGFLALWGVLAIALVWIITSLTGVGNPP